MLGFWVVYLGGLQITSEKLIVLGVFVSLIKLDFLFHALVERRLDSLSLFFEGFL